MDGPYKIHKYLYDEVKAFEYVFCHTCKRWFENRSNHTEKYNNETAHTLHNVDDCIRAGTIAVFDDEGDIIDLKLPPEPEFNST